MFLITMAVTVHIFRVFVTATFISTIGHITEGQMTEQCYSTAVQNDIYRSLHDTIKEHMVKFRLAATSTYSQS